MASSLHSQKPNSSLMTKLDGAGIRWVEPTQIGMMMIGTRPNRVSATALKSGRHSRISALFDSLLRLSFEPVYVPPFVPLKFIRHHERYSCQLDCDFTFDRDASFEFHTLILVLSRQFQSS